MKINVRNTLTTQLNKNQIVKKSFDHTTITTKIDSLNHTQDDDSILSYNNTLRADTESSIEFLCDMNFKEITVKQFYDTYLHVPPKTGLHYKPYKSHVPVNLLREALPGLNRSLNCTHRRYTHSSLFILSFVDGSVHQCCT